MPSFNDGFGPPAIDAPLSQSPLWSGMQLFPYSMRNTRWEIPSAGFSQQISTICMSEAMPLGLEWKWSVGLAAARSGTCVLLVLLAFNTTTTQRSSCYQTELWCDVLPSFRWIQGHPGRQRLARKLSQRFRRLYIHFLARAIPTGSLWDCPRHVFELWFCIGVCPLVTVLYVGWFPACIQMDIQAAWQNLR